MQQSVTLTVKFLVHHDAVRDVARKCTQVLLLEHDINTSPFTPAVHACVPLLPWSVTQADVDDPKRCACPAGKLGCRAISATGLPVWHGDQPSCFNNPERYLMCLCEALCRPS